MEGTSGEWKLKRVVEGVHVVYCHGYSPWDVWGARVWQLSLIIPRSKWIVGVIRVVKQFTKC